LLEIRDIKTTHGPMMPPPVQLLAIRCKCFPYQRCCQ